MRNWFKKLGEEIIGFLLYIGKLTILFFQTLFWIFIPPFKKRALIEQLNKVGVNSFSIVFLTSIFTGIVIALQGAYQMQRISAEIYVASLVALSMWRGIGPVLTGLIIAGRIGASNTAEIGTMKVSEQIDALEVLATNPVKYLIVPRFLSLLVMLPILTIYANIIGMFGGFIVGVYKLDISPSMYLSMTFDALGFKDIFTGLIKSVVFAMIITIVSCFEGLDTKGGAEGVGKATTASVVISFIMIIAADCLFTMIFYFLM